MVDVFVTGEFSPSYAIGQIDTELLLQSTRAWGTFPGYLDSGTIAAASYPSWNVSGIVKNSPGNYKVEFAVPLTTSGYVVTVSQAISSGTNQSLTWTNIKNQTPSAFTVLVNSGLVSPGIPADNCTVNFSVWHNQ